MAYAANPPSAESNAELGMQFSITNLPNELVYLITDYLDQVDVKQLTFTCRKLGGLLSPILLEGDIRDKTYNSLAWACLFGNISLAKAALANGASPNAAFCREKATWLVNNPVFSWNGSSIACPRGEGFDDPVFPSRELSAGLLPQKYSSCTAISLATKRNHVEIIRLLLDSGADTIERRWRLVGTSPDSLQGLECLHPTALSHVCSVAAAETLLGSGASQYINNIESTGSTPLEMVLDRCRAAEKNHEPAMNESELYDVLQLFFKHGARVRVMSELTQFPRIGTLSRAIATECLKVVSLVATHEVSNPTGHRREWHEALRGILSKSYSLYRDWPQGFENDLLEALLEAGVSPNEHISLRPTGSLLFHAIKLGNYRVAHTLIDRGADIDFAIDGWPDDFSPLSKLVHLGQNEGDVQSQEASMSAATLVSRFIRAGAEVNYSSFGPSGLTPLMLATSDLVEASVFTELLQQGASHDFVSDWLSGTPVSILQSLLCGFPKSNSQNPALTFQRYIYGSMRVNPMFVGTRPELLARIEKNRKAKFSALRESLKPSNFRTHDGQHILNWAIESLHGFDLEWAVQMLAPQYASTKLPSDIETPLFSLFGSCRRAVHLKISTLDLTYNLVSELLDTGLRADDMIDGETILHRVYQLNMAFPKQQEWDTQRRLCDGQLDMGGSFLERVHEIASRQRKPRIYSCELRYSDLDDMAYLRARSRNLSAICMMLLKNGADPHAKDKFGRTAHDHACASGIIEWIPMDWS